MERLERGILFMPNVDHLVRLQKDKDFYEAYRQADWVICDSVILQRCSRLLKHPIVESIPGSTFFHEYCDYHKDDENVRIYIMGGKEGVPQRAMERINEKTGRKMVVGAYSPSYGFEKKQDENEQIYRMINESGANVVLVGVGCPKQEKWIDAHKDKMPGVDIWMALGATIDFEAGNIKRALEIWRKMY